MLAFYTLDAGLPQCEEADDTGPELHEGCKTFRPLGLSLEQFPLSLLQHITCKSVSRQEHMQWFNDTCLQLHCLAERCGKPAAAMPDGCI